MLNSRYPEKPWYDKNQIARGRSHQRTVLNLNGEWQIAKTGGELPEAFYATAPVPGLVDLATPALNTAGTVYGDKSWYWHRRTFDKEKRGITEWTLSQEERSTIVNYRIEKAKEALK